MNNIYRGYFFIIFLGICLFNSVVLFGQNEIHLSEPTLPSNGSERAKVKIIRHKPDSPFAADALAADALSVLKTIEGINFDEDGANTGFFHIPPDPIGAAGPNHVVSVVNTSIEWHTKSGLQQNSEDLHTFFSSLSPQSVFDPKVIYDQYAGRFVVVVLDQTESPNTSRILLAVTAATDPNGTWYFHSINSLVNIGGTDHWADYPGFAVDEEAVYVTANMFPFGGGSLGGALLWIIDKNPFYSGGSAMENQYNPPDSVGEAATTAQPAHTFGTVPSSPNVGTWLVRYSGFTDGTNEALSIIQVNDPLGTPSFSHQFLSVGNIDSTSSGMPDAPQSGTSRLIETNDRRALQAVWRNDELWICAQVVPPSGSDAGQATAHWWQVNTTNLSNNLTLTDQGNVRGEDIATDTYTFFPAISVDKNDNMAIGFSASASSIFPGAYYTGRLSTDPAGTVQPSETLAVGLDYYIRTFDPNPFARNRWGDYSGMSVDPIDEETFWVFNEYAITRGSPTTGGEDGRWGTRFANFTFAAQSISPGDIIITEIMQNPAAVPDTAGEWFEIYNTTASPIDLNGWTIRDDGSDSHIIGGPLIISANGFLALGNNDSSSTNGDYTANYQYLGFTLENADDEVVLEDPDGTEIDRVDYDGGPNFPDPTGASMALVNFQSDNNVGSNWITSTVREPTFVGSTGDLGSPGTLGFDQALPVTLSLFTATTGDQKVTLHWVTESEVNNIGFKILRATAIEGPFQVISSFENNPDLAGQFNSNISHPYSFADNFVVNGITYWYKLVDVDAIGIESEQGPISATPQSGEVTTISSELPSRFALHPNYPNPFNPETTIRFDIPLTDRGTGLIEVDLTIYNTLGQKIRNLFEGQLSPGTHAVNWNGDLDNGNLAPGGTYFAVLKVGENKESIKIILLK